MGWFENQGVPTTTPGDLGPYANDWSPRNPDGSLYTGGIQQMPDNGSSPEVRTPESAGGQGYQYGPGNGGSAPSSGGWTGSPTDYQGIFNWLFPGETVTPEMLAEKKDILAQYGITVNPNAAGQYTDITLPTGQVVDPIQGAGSGMNRKQWLVQGPGGATGGVGGYQMGTFTGGGQYPLAAVSGPGFMQPWTTPFNAPTAEQARNTPGYQFAFGEAMKALNRGAAAKGTLLTGGTLKDTMEYATGMADQNYGNVYNRAMGEYQQAYNIFNNNQNSQYNRLAGISGSGQNAAAGTGAAGMNYVNQGANLLTGAGNAQAAGQIGSANAWGGAIGNSGQNAANLYLYNQLYGAKPVTPPSGYAPNPNAQFYPGAYGGSVNV